LSPNFFLEMRSNLKMDPVSVNSVICMARGFFNFMVRKGYYDENPVRDIPFLRKTVVAPFWLFPKKADTVKRKVSPFFFHIQPGKGTPMLSAFSADCKPLGSLKRLDVPKSPLNAI